MNLSGGYAAGSGADMLYKIVEQAAQREQERKRNALAQEELRQRAKDRAAEQDYRNRSLKSLDDDRRERQAAADEERGRRAAADAATAEGRQRDDVRAEAEQTLPGTVFSADQGARFKKYAPTTVEPYGLDPKGAANPQEDLASSTQRLAPTGQLRFRGTAAQQEKQATLDAQTRPEPVFVIDDKGVMRQVGTAPKGSHISNEPRAPTPQRERYQIQPDGKGGLVRVDIDASTATPVQMGGAAVQVKGAGTTTPAGIQQQQTTATNVRKHLEDVGKEAAILDQMGLMGPVGSRWADFMAGRIGAGELAAGDPQKAQLLGEFRADVKLLQSGMAMVHGGARGGSSPGMASRMESIINADRMDLPLFQGALSSFDKWLAGYEKPGPAPMPKMAPEPGHTPTGRPKAGGSKEGAVTVMDPQGGSHTFPNQAAADAFKKAAGIR